MTTTPLPPPPTFNRESVVLPTADGPAAAALHPLSGAAAGSPIPDDCVVVPRATLIKLADELKRLKQFERLPSFLTADHLRRHA